MKQNSFLYDLAKLFAFIFIVIVVVQFGEYVIDYIETSTTIFACIVRAILAAAIGTVILAVFIVSVLFIVVFLNGLRFKEKLRKLTNKINKGKVIIFIVSILLASCAVNPKKFGYPKGTQMNTDWKIRKL